MSKLKTDIIKSLKSNTLSVDGNLVVNGNLKVGVPNPTIGPIVQPWNFHYSGLITIPITAGLLQNKTFSLYDNSRWEMVDSTTFGPPQAYTAVMGSRELAKYGPTIIHDTNSGYWWKLPHSKTGRPARRIRIYTNLNDWVAANNFSDPQYLGLNNMNIFDTKVYGFRDYAVYIGGISNNYLAGGSQRFANTIIGTPYMPTNQCGIMGGNFSTSGNLFIVPGQSINGVNGATIGPGIVGNPFEPNAGGPGTIYFDSTNTLAGSGCLDNLVGDFMIPTTAYGQSAEGWYSGYLNVTLQPGGLFPFDGDLKVYYVITY